MTKFNNDIFRKTAIEHYLKDMEVGSVLMITPPWTWALFWSFVLLMALTFGASVVFRVEVRGYGRGVVWSTQGEVISFLPEKNRAFIHPGDHAQVEFEPYPNAEFRSVAAKVLCVAGDLAAAHEIQQVLGEGTKLESPVFRVKLQIEDDRRTKMKSGSIYPGMLLRVRFTLRRQRLITLAMNSLRGWPD